MSFDLYVWHEPAPITAEAAAAKVAAWAAGDRSVFTAHVSVPLLRAELLARFPPADEPGDASNDGPSDASSERPSGASNDGPSPAPADEPSPGPGGEPAVEENGGPGAGVGMPAGVGETAAGRESASRAGNGDGLARQGQDAYVWSISPAPSESVLVLSCTWPHARLVGDAVRDGAKRHGLVCFDPQEVLVEPNAPGPTPAFTLSSALLAPVSDPDDRLLERTVRHLSADNFFVVLERVDGWFVQVGFGSRAGAADGVYALEFQEGSPERHFRCDTADLGEAVRLVREFRTGLDGWRQRHAWRSLEL